MRLGSVALVGAGPGDPGLMTVRGLALLRHAEVVVYDRLVDPRLLREAPRARHVFAGKASGDHALPRIARELIAHGRAPHTPVALVRWGTTDWQTILTGRLDDVAARARVARLEPPVVIVIGEVVALAERLAWFRPERAMEHALG